MTSLISHFGYVCVEDDNKNSQDPSRSFSWDGNETLATNLNRLGCPFSQLRILFEQALAASYYKVFYGLKCHEMISDFIDELATDITGRFTRNCAKKFNDNYNFHVIYASLMDLASFLRGGRWPELNIELVSQFIFDGNNRLNVPCVWTNKNKGTLIPFLMWMNRGVQEGYNEFSCSEGCGVMIARFGINLDHLTIHLDSFIMSRSFNAQKTNVDQRDGADILSYLSHFDLSFFSLEQVIGLISQFCFHTDIEREGLTPTHQLAYCFKQGMLYPSFDLSGNHTGIDPIVARDRGDLFLRFTNFVRYCTVSCGLVVSDKNLIAKAFGCIAFTKEQKDSAAYLSKSAATASSDELKSFQKLLGSIESFQLISQSPALMDAQTSSQVTGSTEAADTGDSKGEGKTESDSKEADQSADKSKPEEPEKKEVKTDDKGEPSNDDDGADDTQSDDTIEEAPKEVGSGDATTDAGESSDSSADVTSNTQDGAPAEVNTSDEKGIAFELSPPDSATVDSVLFREEMYKFLTNVLTNPPKCLSPQDIETLTALKRYWLSCLSIETIKGIVEACIKLPKSITNSITKNTELKQ